MLTHYVPLLLSWTHIPHRTVIIWQGTQLLSKDFTFALNTAVQALSARSTAFAPRLAIDSRSLVTSASAKGGATRELGRSELTGGLRMLQCVGVSKDVEQCLWCWDTGGHGRQVVLLCLR